MTVELDGESSCDSVSVCSEPGNHKLTWKEILTCSFWEQPSSDTFTLYEARVDGYFVRFLNSLCVNLLKIR